MRTKALVKAFSEKKIDKKVFWQLMRAKYLPLMEYVDLLKNNDSCESIEIQKEQIILKTNGVSILFDFRQTFSRAEIILSMGGDYEKDDFGYLTSILQGDEVVLDVGANVGLFSLYLINKLPKLQIYAFEPLKPTFEAMKKNLSLNPKLRERIIPINKGFSSEEGVFGFYLPGDNEAASMRPIEDEYYLQESDVNGFYTGEKKQECLQCHVDTIDNFCKEKLLNKIGLIKCDVEGAEKDVLFGAKHCLILHQPIVYCELLRKHAKRFGYHPNEIIQYMKELGYCCIAVRNQKPIIFTNMTDETEETNFIFLHTQKHAETLASIS